MKHLPREHTIAGTRLMACPDCGALVREDLLDTHRRRRHLDTTPSRVQHTSPPGHAGDHQRQPYHPDQQGTDSQNRSFSCHICGSKVPVVQFHEHLSRCGRPRTQNTPHHTAPIMTDTRQPLTRDGYRIDRCWACGHRICLVTQNGTGDRVYDITLDHRRGDIHLCDGAPSDSRRTRLTYINPQVGSIARTRKKRR